MAESGAAMGGHVSHLDTCRDTHTHGYTHTCTHSPPCNLPALMLAKSNFELTHKYDSIKLLHMALNPVHFIDTLTSHYPVGKYPSLHHDLIHHVFKNTANLPIIWQSRLWLPERVSDISLMFSFGAAPWSSSLLIPLVFGLQMGAGSC